MATEAADQHNVTWEHRQAELWDRIFQVTQDVVTLADTLEDTAGGAVMKQELVKSAMGVGQQLVRATASEQANEFRRHVQEARFKAIEADYWLRLAYMLQQRDEVQRDLSSIITQYSAIVDLLQKLTRHTAEEKDAIARHSRGRFVS